MPEINGINPVNTYSREYSNQSNPKDKSVQNERQIKDKTVKTIDNDNYIYEDPRKEKARGETGIDPVKRPIKIDDSNNIFYINHNGKNETVKVEPGEYNLTELSNEIQRKVNESFGIGKVKVELTGSGSDRLLMAEDKSIFKDIPKEE